MEHLLQGPNSLVGRFELSQHHNAWNHYRITQYDHIHVYDKEGQYLNAELSVVNYRSPEALIQIPPDQFNYSQE